MVTKTRFIPKPGGRFSIGSIEYEWCSMWYCPWCLRRRRAFTRVGSGEIRCNKCGTVIYTED